MERRTPRRRRTKGLLLESRAERALAGYPRLAATCGAFYRVLLYSCWRLAVTARKPLNPLDFDRIYWVSPEDIRFCTEREFAPLANDGRCLGGDWDLSNKRFEDLNVFISLRDHFGSGVRWEDTEFYAVNLERIRQGYCPSSCSSKDDLDARCASIDALYRNIEQNGFKTQEELGISRVDARRIDEISVNLDRNGRILFNNGAHRCSIAKLLRICSVPVRVTVCHRQCRDFTKLGDVR